MIPKSVTEVIDRQRDIWFREGDTWVFIETDGKLRLGEEELDRQYGPLHFAMPPIEITDEIAASVAAEAGYMGFEMEHLQAWSLVCSALKAAGLTVTEGGGS